MQLMRCCSIPTEHCTELRCRCTVLRHHYHYDVKEVTHNTLHCPFLHCQWFTLLTDHVLTSRKTAALCRAEIIAITECKLFSSRRRCCTTPQHT